jgi:hypothetical protein
MRRVNPIGRRRLLQASREVIKKGLDSGNARIRNGSAGDLGESWIRHAGLRRDVSQIALFVKQTSTDGVQPLLVLSWHLGSLR